MTLKELFADKDHKPKEKTERISCWLEDKAISIHELIEFAITSKEPVKATCIEAIEFATNKNPQLATEECFHFVIASLSDKAPRIKWESARVIGNIAALYQDDFDAAIDGLLKNTSHPGTVVRWSAAYALGVILKLKTKYNIDLLPAIESIILTEEKNSIKKIYLEAVKKINK